jgi:subtilisin family serine protease
MYSSRSAYLLNGTVQTSYLPYLSLSGTSQATPVVAGTVALMLQANPALTPNAVKAILEYTSQNYADYDALTQGAGFLNAYGAIELARFFADPSAPFPAGTGWSRQLIWGNHRVAGGVILPDANAWSPGVVWGETRHNSADVTFGLAWSPADNASGGSWTRWGTSCGDPACVTVRWDSPRSENVVWGSWCGGGDCASATSPGVWSTSVGDAVVWGTTSHDAVVWGTTGDDAVVWGTTSDYAVVWGTSCTEPSCL